MIFQNWNNFTFSYKKHFIKWFLFGLWVLLIVIGFILSFNSVSSWLSNRIWLVDTSLSMKAKDISGSNGNISRIELAKKILLSDSFEWKRALMTFARVTSLQIPLTGNKLLFENTVKNIEITQWAGGSDISKAISQVIDIYSDTKQLQVVVITDWETFDTKDMPKDSHWNLDWVLVGVGTQRGATLVEGYDQDGAPRYKTYQWDKVVSRLDSDFLRKLASKLSWPLIEIKDEKDIDLLYSALPSSLWDFYVSPSHWFVFLGILSIIISFFILPYRYHKYD